MLINAVDGEEVRIAVIDNDKLQELYIERTNAALHVGNIYKGKVTNIEPSIQAAFVDFGLGRNGFLHISDLLPTYFGRNGGGGEAGETVGRKLGRRDRPPIQRCLRRGDEITVQILKEGIGTKGPTLTSYLSVPGRILVMTPGMGGFGVSRKIEDDGERRRLRAIMDEFEPVEGLGFIVRTAGMGKTKAEIQRDLDYLTHLWEQVETRARKVPAPAELYTEGDLVTRTVRDVFTADIERVLVDSEEVAERVRDFLELTQPRSRNRVEFYDDPIPLFHRFGVERELDIMNSRTVPLPGGGSLVIDSTEAVVAIDVNSGKNREHSDAEMSAFKTDMEAAEEIPRQLKLRDLGGVIICDFIDLRFDKNKRELEEKLFENFKKDRAKTKVLRMSEFGIIQVTRQRMRPSVKRSMYDECSHCHGTGQIKNAETISLDVMRKLAIAVHDDRVSRAELTVNDAVCLHVSNRKRAALAQLERENEKTIILKPDATLAPGVIKISLFDAREGRVYLESLGMQPEPGEQRTRQMPASRSRDIRQRPKPEPVQAYETYGELDVDDSPDTAPGRSRAPQPMSRGRSAGGRDEGDRDRGRGRDAGRETGRDPGRSNSRGTRSAPLPPPPPARPRDPNETREGFRGPQVAEEAEALDDRYDDDRDVDSGPDKLDERPAGRGEDRADDRGFDNRPEGREGGGAGDGRGRRRRRRGGRGGGAGGGGSDTDQSRPLNDRGPERGPGRTPDRTADRGPARSLPPAAGYDDRDDLDRNLSGRDLPEDSEAEGFDGSRDADGDDVRGSPDGDVRPGGGPDNFERGDGGPRRRRRGRRGGRGRNRDGGLAPASGPDDLRPVGGAAFDDGENLDDTGIDKAVPYDSGTDPDAARDEVDLTFDSSSAELAPLEEGMAEAVGETGESEAEPAAKAGRGRSGSRSRSAGRKPAKSAKAGDEAPAKPAAKAGDKPKRGTVLGKLAKATEKVVEKLTKAGKPARRPPTKSDMVPLPPIVPTGSVDKHLADDEPVAPVEEATSYAPSRRVRSVRDLDEIPYEDD